MRSFLLQPYPFTQNPARKLALCAGIGLFIALFLGLFKPFGFNHLPPATAWAHAFFYGGVTLLVSALFQVGLPVLFPKPFREEGWRSWKEIVYLLVTTAAVGGGNFLLSLVLYPQSGSFLGFLWAELMTLEVGIFPVSFIVFLKQVQFYRRFATDAKVVTEDIRDAKRESAGRESLSFPPTAPAQKQEGVVQSPVPSPSGAEEKGPEPQLTLRGENQKEALSLLPGDLLFIASADNYVNVHHFRDGSPKSTLLRGSLKGFEEQLNGYNHFFRCHRMYLVNLQAVTGVTGNAQGLKLHLRGDVEAIPVSRSLTETVKERLHALSRSPQNA